MAVRWYLRFGLSYRDLKELHAERVDVDHVTLFRWVQRFTPLLVSATRLRYYSSPRPDACRHASGRGGSFDNTYVKVAGAWRYVHRAIDEHGQVIDVLVSRRLTSSQRRCSLGRLWSRTVTFMTSSRTARQRWPA